MKVFISWSGDRSKLVGELLSEWLKCVIQNVVPWYSPNDIDRGEVWFNAISSELSETTTGIICLTRENYERPWILYEAGALTKGISTGRILTFLIDIAPDELARSPLYSYNHTFPDKDGVLKLVRTINTKMERALDHKTLDSVFELFWPRFELRFKEILKRTDNIDPKQQSEVNVTQRDFNDLVRAVRDLTGIVHEKIGKKGDHAGTFFMTRDDIAHNLYSNQVNMDDIAKNLLLEVMAKQKLKPKPKRDDNDEGLAGVVA